MSVMLLHSAKISISIIYLTTSDITSGVNIHQWEGQNAFNFAKFIVLFSALRNTFSSFVSLTLYVLSLYAYLIVLYVLYNLKRSKERDVEFVDSNCVKREATPENMNQANPECPRSTK